MLQISPLHVALHGTVDPGYISVVTQTMQGVRYKASVIPASMTIPRFPGSRDFRDM